MRQAVARSESGELRCTRCEAFHPVIDGVPVFLPRAGAELGEAAFLHIIHALGVERFVIDLGVTST